MQALDREICAGEQMQTQLSVPDLQWLWVLTRDAATFAVLCQSCRRGQDILRLDWGRLYLNTVPTRLTTDVWDANVATDLAGPVPLRLYLVPLQTKVLADSSTRHLDAGTAG
jgi:hypothetical protein